MTIRVLKKKFFTLEIVEMTTFEVSSIDDVPELLDSLDYDEEFVYHWEVI